MKTSVISPEDKVTVAVALLLPKFIIKGHAKFQLEVNESKSITFSQRCL